jgi:pre-rRNA-processing protein TSR3
LAAALCSSCRQTFLEKSLGSRIDAGMFETRRRDVIIRHPRERRSKCSLTPLEGREDLTFFKAREGWEFDPTGYTVLALDAQILSGDDAQRPLLILDSTWRLLPQVEACLSAGAVRRSLPAATTAYPRMSKIDKDPMGGLASVEALYLARLLIGARDDTLLDDYYWRDSFLNNLKKAGFL